MPISWKPVKPKGITPQKLKALYPKFADIMGDFVTKAHDMLATYPAKPPESRYRRTGTLGRSWSHRVQLKSDVIEGIVGSQGQIAPYNIQVQGPQQSARMRAIGWRTPKDVIGKLEPEFKKKVKDAMKEAAG